MLQHPTTKRAKEIDSHPPFHELESLLQEQKDEPKPKVILHWFRAKDLRIRDNKALFAASEKAQEAGVPRLRATDLLATT